MGKADAAAGAIIFAKQSKRFLLVKCSNKVTEPGKWGLVGGHIESGETPEQALLREMQEEVKLTFSGKLHPLYVFEPNKHDNSAKYTTFLAMIEMEFTPVLNDEHTEFLWVKSLHRDNLPVRHYLHPRLAALLDNPSVIAKIQQLTGTGKVEASTKERIRYYLENR